MSVQLPRDEGVDLTGVVKAVVGKQHSVDTAHANSASRIDESAGALRRPGLRRMRARNLVDAAGTPLAGTLANLVAVFAWARCWWVARVLALPGGS